MEFRPDRVDRFRLTHYEADLERRTAVLRYSLDEDYHFEERVEFDSRSLGEGADGSQRRSPTEASSPRPGASQGAASGFERVVRLLHLVAGVSYYKTAAPRHLVVETGRLTDSETVLCQDLYDKGLREFAYRNHLEIPRELDIDSDVHETDAPGSLPAVEAEAPPEGIAVPIGGGKDSIVVLEALRDLRPLLVSVNPNAATWRIASRAKSEMVVARRTLDPLLFDLNGNGALNGHVPITAIVSLIAVAGGYLFGYDTTAMALESSADEPTRMVAGSPREGSRMPLLHDVNHQWSKSADFEQQLQGVLRDSVHPAIRYLSPLRTFNELEVTAAFATLEPYLHDFRSCNGGARLVDPVDRWCCDCPKCRFVFLALATALGRRKVVGVFGADMLDDETQFPGFMDMLDPQAKPFECVGTVEEVEYAMSRVLADPQWTGAIVVERIRAQSPSRRLGPVHELTPASPAEVFDTVRHTLAKSPVR